LLVDQSLGGMGIRQRFQTRARLERPARITIEGDQAPFRRLHQTWEFVPEGAQATTLRFTVDYSLRGALLGRVIDRFCEHVFRETVDAFERRARVRLKQAPP
jgi:ribosome-associated toxin RatA of RatAB toxin-antitoxin module